MSKQTNKFTKQMEIKKGTSLGNHYKTQCSINKTVTFLF